MISPLRLISSNSKVCHFPHHIWKRLEARANFTKCQDAIYYEA